MIKKRNFSNGINANLSLDPNASSQSTSNISNNIYIGKRDEDEVVVKRDIEPEVEHKSDVRDVILQTYANILLNQDKTLLSNLIFKDMIIVPINDLQLIIKTIINAESVDVYFDEDVKCCATKVNPIRKIDAIKIINDSGEIITDFKQVYNKEYNELTNMYHLCLKYVVV